MHAYHVCLPLTEEITLQIFGSRDLTIFSLDLLSDEDSVYTREKLVCNFGDSRENVLDIYGDSYENLYEVLAIEIIVSGISSVCGMQRHIYICMCIIKHASLQARWYRVAKTHRIPYLYRSFSAKET